LLSGKSLRNRRTPEAVETMQSEGGDEEEEEEEESSGQEIEESQEEWSGWGWLGGEIGRPGERGGFKGAGGQVYVGDLLRWRGGRTFTRYDLI